MSKPKIHRGFNEKYPEGDRIGQCAATNKVMYPTEDDALLDARRVRKRHKSKLKPYQCKYCGSWHNGHDRAPSRRRQMTARDKFDLHSRVTLKNDVDNSLHKGRS